MGATKYVTPMKNLSCGRRGEAELRTKFFCLLFFQEKVGQKGETKAAGELLHGGGGVALGGAHGLVDSGHDEILQHLHIVRVHRVGVDLQAFSSRLPETVAVTTPPPALAS